MEAYLNLKTENRILNNRIAELESQIQHYSDAMSLFQEKDSMHFALSDYFNSNTFTFLPAKVVYNNISGINNYITLKMGSNDGVREDMGVVSASGIVGVVRSVSPHFSLVIPILNSKFRPSCKVKNNNYFGPLCWDGQDPSYSYLQELPRTLEFQLGDTIVTSGYSSLFPEGLPVGTIVDSQKQENDNYISLKVKLFTDFNSLTNAIIIINNYADEQNALLNTIQYVK